MYRRWNGRRGPVAQAPCGQGLVGAHEGIFLSDLETRKDPLSHQLGPTFLSRSRLFHAVQVQFSPPFPLGTAIARSLRRKGERDAQAEDEISGAKALGGQTANRSNGGRGCQPLSGLQLDGVLVRGRSQGVLVSA